MARDLREIMASIRIAGDLERVGDLAKNTAKRVIAIEGNFGAARLVAGVEHIAELSLTQLKNVLDAFAARDLAAALAVWERDEEIDAVYTSLFRELLTYMMEDPRNITFCTHLLFCAKNLERIGDHATNIAETLHYLITGAVLADERPKKDTSSLTSVEYKDAG
jgi:phosphate transport system protein